MKNDSICRACAVVTKSAVLHVAFCQYSVINVKVVKVKINVNHLGFTIK